MDQNKKLSLIERAIWENLEAQPRQEVQISPNWVQLTSPFAPTPHMNSVLRCEFPQNDIDQQIDKTLAHFKSKGLPFRWKVSPSSKPADLGLRLQKKGLVLKEKLFGLFADANLLKVEANPKVRVEPLSLQNLEDWLTVQVTAWSVPPPGISYLRTSLEAALKSGGTKSEKYLAYLDGKPVGSAGMQVTKDYVYLMGGAVAEVSRGKGIYRALVAHRLDRCRELKLPVIVHCLEKTSAPICLKLGFEKVCEIDSFELLM